MNRNRLSAIPDFVPPLEDLVAVPPAGAFVVCPLGWQQTGIAQTLLWQQAYQHALAAVQANARAARLRRCYTACRN